MDWWVAGSADRWFNGSGDRWDAVSGEALLRGVQDASILISSVSH